MKRTKQHLVSVTEEDESGIRAEKLYTREGYWNELFERFGQRVSDFVTGTLVGVAATLTTLGLMAKKDDVADQPVQRQEYRLPESEAHRAPAIREEHLPSSRYRPRERIPLEPIQPIPPAEEPIQSLERLPPVEAPKDEITDGWRPSRRLVPVKHKKRRN